MLYSQLVVKLLEHISEADGAYSGVANHVSAKALVGKIADGIPEITVRKLHMAVQELVDEGLVSVGHFGASGLERDSVGYIDMDVTGPGLRFVESLRYQAKQEGKDKSWFWSGVEKAANLAQLVSLVIQAAATAIGR